MPSRRSEPILREQFFAHVGQTSPSPLAIEIEKAEGVFLYGPRGRRYYDLVAGVSVSNVGHGRKEVIDAICGQAAAFTHLMVYGEIVERPQVEYASLLARHLPPAMDTVYFVNSGAEANEAALKLAKRATGRPCMAYFKNAYHGSTQGCLSVLGDEYYKQAFRPLLPGTRALEFNDFASLEQIDQQVACVLAEPLQGEAGIVEPVPGFLEALRDRCTQTGALLIFDEVQTGFGRLGTLFAMDYYHVIPDMVTLAKALGGGMPLGALACNRAWMNLWQTDPVLGHITTFGGHPVCCAAGLSALKVLLEEPWMAQAQAKGDIFKSRLSAHPLVKEVRGTGLLLAVELGSAERVQNLLHNLLTLPTGVMSDWFLFCDTAFRISPPLSITEDEIEDVCSILCKALDQLN